LKGLLNLGDVLLDNPFGTDVGMAVELWTVSIWLNKLFGKHLRVARMGKIPRKGGGETLLWSNVRQSGRHVIA